MMFETYVKFLGMVENKLKDGGVYYAISLYEEQAGSFTCNVMSNHDVVPMLRECKFGDDLRVLFTLVPKDKLYRLSIKAAYHE